MDGPDAASLRRRMAVFADSATLDAAVAVCAGERVDPEAVADLLSSLVASRLLERVERSYRLSAADRSACRQELATNGELEALRTRHAAYYAEWGAKECRRLGGPERATARQQLECDLPNLYAALDRLIAQEAVTTALGLAGWLRNFWWDTGRTADGLAWFARLLTLPALAGRTVQRAAALDHSGALAFKAGDLAAAHRFVAEGLAIHRVVGAKANVLASLLHLSSILRYGDDIAAARVPLEEALSFVQEPGMEPQRAAVLINLGQVATMLGDAAEARRCFAEALPTFLQREQVTPLPFALENLAVLEVADGEPARALRLASAAERQRRLFELPELAPHLRAGLGAYQEQARAALGPEATQAAWAAGQTLSLEQAVAEGLDGGADH